MADLEHLERPTSALDNLTRLNLLDIVLERTRALNKKSLVHCMIYIGRLNSDQSNSQQAVADFHERFSKIYTGQFHIETITGLLLIYPGHFIHVVEGPENLLKDLVYGVNDRNSGSFMKEVKLVVYRNDAPTRLFSQWSSRILNLISVRMDESKNQDAIETKVTEGINFIMKLAQELSKIPKAQLKTNLDQLTSKFSTALPPQDLIESLIKSKELPLLSTYQQKTFQPTQVVLDSELVWPVQNDFSF